MTIEVFHGASIPRELSSAAMDYLWAKWRTLNGTQALTLQRLTEESSLPLRENFSHLISHGDDFVTVYAGRNIVAAGAQEPPGAMMSAGPSGVASDLLDVFRRAARARAPAFVRFTGTVSQQGEIWQGLVLPVPLAGDLTLIVCYSERAAPQVEVHDHLFAAMSEAMVVARPIVEDSGLVTDGWVMMMNPAARDLLDWRDGIGNLRLRQLPPLREAAFGFRLHPPVAPGETCGHVRAAALAIDIVRFPQVFALRLRALGETAAPPLAPEAPAEIGAASSPESSVP
jgi:PAS domain-containing protein